MEKRPNEPSGACLRKTRQRRVLLEELRGLKTHPTADELYARVRKRLPRISLGTVYRNLEQFVRDGTIRRIDDGAQRRFDGDVHDHYHVRCVRCGRVGDVEIARIKEVEREAQRVSGYRITGHRVVFTGLCPACRKNGGS